MGIELLKHKLDEEDISLKKDILLQLERFADLLQEWNAIHNLTGAKTITSIYDNIVDSAYPVTFISEPSSLLDVGTGAGFPGMILGIIYSKCPTVLCEPLNKRASFLKFIISELSLENISVSKSRVEELIHLPFDMISSRAVTNTKLLLELTSHLSNQDTKYLFFKGSRVFDEVNSFDNQLKYDIVRRNKRNYLLMGLSI